MAHKSKRTSREGLIAIALERIQQARAELIAKRYASLRGDAVNASAHERAARKHLQAAKRLLERL